LRSEARAHLLERRLEVSPERLEVLVELYRLPRLALPDGFDLDHAHVDRVVGRLGALGGPGREREDGERGEREGDGAAH